LSETTKQRRGGRAFHSILAPHFDFIRQLRKQRKTWQEIAESPHSQKGIRVTLYAPYLFYKRQLRRRPRPHWENEVTSQPATQESQPGRPKTPPLTAATCHRPHRTTVNP